LYLVSGLQCFGKTLYLIYALYHQAACRISTSFSRDFADYGLAVLKFLLTTQHGVVSCAKRARVLSRNEIREIVMDSDSDKVKYHATQESENEKEPCPPSQWSSLSQPPSPDYSASSSEDEDDGNVAGQQRQPSQWTLPPKPRRRLVHNFIGDPNGKSSEAAHITPASTPLSVLLLYFTEIVTLLVVQLNRYYHRFLDNFEDGPSPQHDATEAEMFSFLALTLQMGHTVQD